MIALYAFPLSDFAADPATAVKAGEMILERPALISLGFEWRLEAAEPDYANKGKPSVNPQQQPVERNR